MQNELPMVPEKTKKSKNNDKNLLNLQASTAAAAAAAAAAATLSNTKQPLTFDINLPNAPMNETHPLMAGIRRPSSTVAATSNSGNSISSLGSLNKSSKI
jgi:cobalamin biosynthesis protein CbiD